MTKRRRYLVYPVLTQSYDDGFAEAQESAFATCPEAALITDEEAGEFWSAALFLDSVPRETIASSLRRSKINYPVELAFDEYRLSRYLFRRWNDPAVRQSFMRFGLRVDMKRVGTLKRTGDVEALRPNINRWGAPSMFHILRRFGLEHLIQPIIDGFTPEEAVRQKALFQFGKVTLHRFMTESEPARLPSPWEQQKLSRRIRLREVQLRSMRRSLLKLGQERKELQGRLRELGRASQPELKALAAEWAQLRAQLAEGERQHKAALAEQEERYRAEMARLRAEIALSEQDFQKTLALRRTWLQQPRG